MKKVLFVISTILVAAYCIGSFLWTDAKSRDAVCRGVSVMVDDDNDSLKFITNEFILKEIKRLGFSLKGQRLSAIDTQSLEDALSKQYYLESAACYKCNDNTLQVDVVPVCPVMRVFDASGTTYYINRAGKHVPASDGFFMDVPVVCGRFTKTFTPTKLLPLVDYLKAHPDIDALVSSIEARDERNIYIVPNVAGHVVNLGSLDRLDAKFGKLIRFYREVMPVKGWDVYDTISLKWYDQIVATKRDAKPRLWVQEDAEMGHDETPDPQQEVTTASGADSEKKPEKTGN